MTVASVTDHIYNDILLKSLPIFDRKFGYEYTSLWIVAINMENWCLHHASYFCAIKRRPYITRVASGKSELIIDDYMDRTTGFVSTGITHVKVFHHHTLAGKCCVSVD